LARHPGELQALPAEKRVIAAASPADFTVAPHLQIINYPGCFSPLAGI
jgi:hypothetical protein